MGDLVISVLLPIGLPPILCVSKPGNSRSIGMLFRMRPRKSSRKAARPCSELHSRPESATDVARFPESGLKRTMECDTGVCEREQAMGITCEAIWRESSNYIDGTLSPDLQ